MPRTEDPDGVFVANLTADAETWGLPSSFPTHIFLSPSSGLKYKIWLLSLTAHRQDGYAVYQVAFILLG